MTKSAQDLLVENEKLAKELLAPRADEIDRDATLSAPEHPGVGAQRPAGAGCSPANMAGQAPAFPRWRKSWSAWRRLVPQRPW